MKINGFFIQPHEFREHIQIQKAESKIDEDNIPVKAEWTTLVNTRAKVLTNKSDEEIMLNGEGDIIIKTFYIRARKSININTKDRIIYKNKIFNIKSSNDIQDRGIFIEIKGEYRGLDINEYSN